ncbi:TPA: hypothetical protein JI285_18295 [Acinetobacter baumannii]|nr:hypothetical protein DV997_03575 [Acinetobacter baumannii]RDF73155.1 hypothetical protein DWA08_17215 [Acinetobacter baumannii]TDI08077.1 hypothetical protein DWA11_10170 [Acinetobacter baumannii]HAV6042760.1 hypothetical protein [Acinetobacter baumannii]HAV6107617.1 hypothetical protein [Acinetobacter baumannii]
MTILVPSHQCIQCPELQSIIWLVKQLVHSKYQLTLKYCNCALPQHIKLRSTFDWKLSNLRLWVNPRIVSVR